MAIDRQLEEEEIKSQATIYKKETTRPLNNYQKQINEVAQEICVKNPSMLRNRQKLLEMARIRVDESYQFKKGKSRSKRTPPAPKRKKVNQADRLTRMKTLEDDIKNTEQRISYKVKRRQVAEDTKNYRLCDEITEEIGTLTKEKRQLEAELKLLQKKDECSKMYFQRKSASKSPSMSSSRSETYSPPNSDYSDENQDSVPTVSRDVSRDTIILSGNSTDQDSDPNL